MFQNIGPTEVIVAAVVLLILFGPRKLPEFAKGLSEAIAELIKPFKNSTPEEKKKA